MKKKIAAGEWKKLVSDAKKLGKDSPYQNEPLPKPAAVVPEVLTEEEKEKVAARERYKKLCADADKKKPEKFISPERRVAHRSAEEPEIVPVNPVLKDEHERQRRKQRLYGRETARVERLQKRKNRIRSEDNQ